MIHDIAKPYLVFLGDVADDVYAKTAFGLAEWANASCVGQLAFADCRVDVGLTPLSVTQAAQAGARSLVIGVAPVGGAIKDSWRQSILDAIDAGLDIVSGMHGRIGEDDAFRAAAHARRVRLIDVRQAPAGLPIATGRPRSGRRVLTVGTDCAVGKKYTALALTRSLKAAGAAATFRATGQTGIIIAGAGIPIDAVVSDFVAGAAESLSPDNAPHHWDVIEGQGSLFHPSYAGVSLGLLHGSQPDAIIVCHHATRTDTVGVDGYALPDIRACIERNLMLGGLTNPDIRCAGVSVNTSGLDDRQRRAYLSDLRGTLDLPVIDPVATGADDIAAALIGEGAA